MENSSKRLDGKIIVAYYRVSTKQQGFSGLGLESQKNIVERFLNYNQSDFKNQSINLKKPDYEFTDIESGRNNKRINMTLALKKIKEIGLDKCILVIAKLDRLSRNLNFVTDLQKSLVDFICCDMPNANKFTIHLFASVAEYEVELISERTKASLKVLKDRGIKLGNPYSGGEIKKDGTIAKKPFGENRDAAINAVRERIANDEKYQMAKKMAEGLRSNGMNLTEIKNELNRIGHKTPKGGFFTVEQARRLLKDTGTVKYGKKVPSQYKGKNIII